MALGRNLLDQRAHLGAAREADVVYAGVAGEGVAHLVAVAGDDVERPGGEAHLSRQLGHPQQAQAGVFGRFDHTHIACGQRTAHTAAENLHGVVPRHDVAGHAMRLAPGEDAVAVLVGDCFTVEFVAGTGIKLEVTGQRRGVGLGLFGGFAAVALFDHGQLVGVFGHLLRQAHEQATALHGTDLAPDHVETLACRVNGLVDIFGIAALECVKNLAVRRVNDRDGAAGSRRLVGVGDVVELHGGNFTANPP